LVYSFLTGIVNSVSAQEADSSLVKMHLDEAIKYLQAGNKDAAAIHLDNGHRDISSVSTDAQELFEAGMKSLSIGDSSGVLLHLNAADEKLS
jgi:hypothetical protein